MGTITLTNGQTYSFSPSASERTKCITFGEFGGPASRIINITYPLSMPQYGETINVRVSKISLGILDWANTSSSNYIDLGGIQSTKVDIDTYPYLSIKYASAAGKTTTFTLYVNDIETTYSVSSTVDAGMISLGNILNIPLADLYNTFGNNMSISISVLAVQNTTDQFIMTFDCSDDSVADGTLMNFVQWSPAHALTNQAWADKLNGDSLAVGYRKVSAIVGSQKVTPTLLLDTGSGTSLISASDGMASMIVVTWPQLLSGKYTAADIFQRTVTLRPGVNTNIILPKSSCGILL